MEQLEDILKRMEEAYEAESGCKPEDVSDTGLRLRVLAGELYRLRAEIQWLSKQAFPHTAAGEWLDRHGAQRGVTRREAAHAKGNITFSRYLPMSFDLVIPKGTVCSTTGEAPVEFETLEDGVLTAGSLTVSVPAQAVVGGPSGNAAAGYINTLVTALTGVNYVNNTAAFTGGREAESDEEYRARILRAYGDPPSGSNAAYYREIALAWPGVTAAGVSPRANGANTVKVYVWGDGAAPSADVISGLQEELSKRREVGVTVTVQAATTRTFNIGMSVEYRPGTDSARAQADIQTAVRAYFAGMKVGDPVYLADLRRVASNAAPLTYLLLSASLSDYTGQAGILPVPGTIKVMEAG